MSDFDLSVFCGVGKSKFDLSKPVTFGGWTYATDGFMVVRVLSHESAIFPRPDHFPDCAHMFKDIASAERGDPLPSAFRTNDDVDCPHCPTELCEKCEGIGELVCGECGSDYECKECCGRGYFFVGFCAICGGTRRHKGYQVQKICGVNFHGRFIDRLHTVFSELKCSVFADKLQVVGGRGIQAIVCNTTEDLPKEE